MCRANKEVQSNRFVIQSSIAKLFLSLEFDFDEMKSAFSLHQEGRCMDRKEDRHRTHKSLKVYSSKPQTSNALETSLERF